MIRQRFDLAAIAALILTVVLTVWLGLWGPFEISKLQQWQTVMAAIIAPTLALIPATIAYKGAMAKVDHDRQEAERRRNNERLGLYLRLRASLRRTHADAFSRVELIEDKQLSQILWGLRISPNMITVYNPPEVQEAWQALHLIPPSVIVNIEALKQLLPQIEQELSKFADRTWDIKPKLIVNDLPVGRILDDYLRLHATRCSAIVVDCEAIIGELEREIPFLQNRFK
ncbi:hypothetical protein ACQR10_04435 [Bradyrhizobium sp. HKCCYLRH2060]|uniref:hypothetical protein n=1 Tax=Bradyrhizobium sp. HKCCYLRH2060 TaxID=3420743 RepID=UPI003EBFD6F4